LSSTFPTKKIGYALGMDKKTKQRKRSLPHTRAIQRDRSKRVNSAPTDEQIEQWMEEAVQPAIYTQMELYW
jgi:hypothetical protein